jgi:hypothetical protein
MAESLSPGAFFPFSRPAAKGQPTGGKPKEEKMNMNQMKKARKVLTRFNGDHNAGIQVLSTRGFPATFGPLRQLRP